MGGLQIEVNDVSSKCQSCLKSLLIEERKKNGKFSTIEYLDAKIEHEPKCFKNDFASPQVSKLFVFLTEKRNSIPL